MRRLILLVALTSLVAGTANAQANGSVLKFGFQTIDFPGAAATQAFGINERGDVVGNYTDTAGNNHGFLLRNGTFSSIDYPGAILTSTRAINDAGEIAGAFSTSDDPEGAHGYILRDGKYTQRDFPGSAHTGILGINESGNITGSYDLGDINTGIGFFTSRGRFTSFEVPGSAPETTGPHGINDNLQVVGFYVDGVNPDVTHGFLLSSGTFTTIDYPGATVTGVFGINEHGEMVGSCSCIDGTGHAFLLRNGTFTILSYPVASSLTRARGVNDREQIVGFYQSGNTGPMHGFVATPTR